MPFYRSGSMPTCNYYQIGGLESFVVINVQAYSLQQEYWQWLPSYISINFVFISGVCFAGVPSVGFLGLLPVPLLLLYYF